MGWAGIGEHLDRATARVPDGAAMRGQCASCPILQEVANLVSQAYERPGAAPGILAAADQRRVILAIRAEVAEAVMAEARQKLLPTPQPSLKSSSRARL
jgi:hypothetical protein